MFIKMGKKKEDEKKVRIRRPKHNKSICLNMIVKNESHIIHETLNNMKKYIDYWVICDTGSTDGTQQLIKDFFAKEGIPGELHEHKWENFGHNRTLAFEAAYDKTDYVFVMDADDLIEGDFKLPEKMDADAYYLKLGKDFTYDRAQIFKNRKLKWMYKGVLHEFAHCKNKQSPIFERIEGNYYLNSRREGARSKDPKKYLKDAEVLVKGMSTDPDLKVRYAFYAGQSYFDYGDFENAIKYYRMRIEMGEWYEEVYYSWLRIGNALVKLNRDENEITKAYLEGYRVCKERAETLFELGSYYAEKKKYNLALSYLNQAAKIPFPQKSRLFIAENVYTWESKFAIAQVYYMMGNKHEECYNLCEEILRDTKKIPGHILPKLKELKYRCVPFLMKDPAFKDYNDTLVKEITNNVTKKKEQKINNLTLTITSCKRFDLFQQTINSFINCCKDVLMIDKWICIDDNSSEEDRKQMKETYPFFDYVLKGPEDKGHYKSMEMIREMVTSPYLLHMEDDWFFFEKRDYIKPAIEIFEEKDINYQCNVPENMRQKKIGQVLFNLNYTETHDRIVEGGYEAMTKNNNKYIIHEHFNPNSEKELYQECVKKYPNGSCVYWPHYSFRPSIIKTEVFAQVGEYNQKASFFEQDYAYRYYDKGYISAFTNTVSCYHLGRKTWERHDSSIKNAYSLNNEVQFGGQEPQQAQVQKPPQLDGYTFYPNKDSFGSDIALVQNAPVEIMKMIADKEEKCIGFNTYGYLKFAICEENKMINLSNKRYMPDGLYVKNNKNNSNLTNDDIKNIVENISVVEEGPFEESKEAECKTVVCDHCNKETCDKEEVKQEVKEEVKEEKKIEKKEDIKERFLFFENKDSPHCDLKLVSNKSLEELMKICDQDEKCVGFNTYGYLKYKIQPEDKFIDIKQRFNQTGGLYVKKNYKEIQNVNLDIDKTKYKFFKGVDFMGNDIDHYPNYTLEERMLHCEMREDCMGFNTVGYFKTKINLKDLKPSKWFGENDGIYINMERVEGINKKKKTKNPNDIYVKPVTNWLGNEATSYFQRFSKNNDNRWENIVMTDDDEIADYFAVINKPNGNYPYDKSRTVVFHMEPQCGVKTWGEWADPKIDNFLQVRNHKYYNNNNEWHIGKTYQELMTDQIVKYKGLSTVISAKAFDDGHKRRIDFLKFLENKEPNMIDIYGRCRELGFKNYKGELPPMDKTAAFYPYRYSFIAENNAEDNYFTEKIIDSLVTECLCFYWGCPNLESYFPNAFIRLELKDFEKDYQIIKNVMMNNEYQKRLPFIRDAKIKILNKLQIYPTLFQIFNTMESNMMDVFFDKILILNKDDNQWAKLEKKLLKFNISKYERFIVKEMKAPNNNINNVVYEYKKHHLEAIKYAKKKTYENVLIMEDHVILEKLKIGKLNLALYELLEANQEWNVLYLASNNNSFDLGENINNYTKISKSSRIYQSPCYAVHSRCYDEIINSTQIGDLRDNCDYNTKSLVIYPTLIEENKYFSTLEKKKGKTYCLNLKRRPDRRESMVKLFKERNIKEYEFYDAVDGKELTKNETLTKLFQGNDFGSRRGVIGCALSHYYMWHELIKNKQYDYYLFLEDDVEIEPEYSDVIEKLIFDMYAMDPNWDLFYIGYSMFNHHLKPNSHLYRNNGKEVKIFPLNLDFFIGGTFGYLISRRGAEKMCEFIEKNGIKHGIDYLPKKYGPSLGLRMYETRYHLIVSEWVSSQSSPVDSDIQKDYNSLEM